MVRLVLLFFIFFLKLYANEYNNTIIINEKGINNNFNFSYLKTEDNTTITEVSKKNFPNTYSNNFNLGFSSSKIWLKFKIKNNSEKKDFILTINEHFFEKFNLYYYDKKWQKKENGLFHPAKQREIKSNKLAFNIHIEKDKTQTYYIELKGKYAYFGHLELMDKEIFYLNNQFNINNLFILILGCTILVASFTFLLTITLKEKIYLYYFLYSLFYFIYIINISGLLVYVNLQDYIYLLQASSGFGVAFLILFSIEYLKTKKYLKSFHYILILCVVLLLSFSFLMLTSYTPWNKFLNNLLTISNLLLIITTTVLYFKGHRYVSFYLVTLLIYLVFVVLYTSMISGNIEYDFFSRYAFVGASLFELICFSLILVNRYNNLKNEKINLQKELIDFQQKQEVVLKEEVFKKTNQLQTLNTKLNGLLSEREVLLKEIFHRVKNNFHMISGLLWFESKKHEDNKPFINLINRIDSMSKLHETLLYNSKNIENINTNDYLENIINNIKKSYTDNTMIIDISIEKLSLEFNESLSLGLIINEIISNSIKHTSKNETNHLIINLFYQSENIVLEIIDREKELFEIKEKGLGLKLVDEFVSNLHEANYQFIQKEGLCFQLIFKKVDKNG